MKVGLFIVGFNRDAPINIENYSQFINFDCDLSVYVASWDCYDINRQTHKLDTTPSNIYEKMTNVFRDKLKNIWIGNAVRFYDNMPEYERKLVSNHILEQECSDEIQSHNGYPYLQRVFDQAYVWKKAYNLAYPSVFESFDVVIKIRADMSFIGKPLIPFWENEDGIHVGSHWWQDNGYDMFRNLPVYKISDQLAWGKPQFMKIYFNYYDDLPQVIQLVKHPHTAFEYTCEHLLAIYLQLYNSMPIWQIPMLKSTDVVTIENMMANYIKLYRHGYPEMIQHHTNTGISKYDYYDLMTRGIR